MRMYRMWINQPAKTQDFHRLHGKKVLAPLSGSEIVTIYFIDGDVVCQQIFKHVLEEGWHE